MKSLIVNVLLFEVYGRRGRRKNRDRERGQKNSLEDCYEPESFNSYRGDISRTAQGFICQKWNENSPHQTKFRPSNSDHNYCRNPDNDPNGPWCYTTDPRNRYDYCNVKHCKDQKRKGKVPGKTCLPNDDRLGVNFSGSIRFAQIEGKNYQCQSWNAVRPHRSMYLINEKHNYCRNPNNDPNGPWCYVHHKKKSIGYCTSIQMCEGRVVKSGRCGIPHVQPEFKNGIMMPTVLRTRRDESHVENGLQRYTQEYDYYSYDGEQGVENQSPNRQKTFISELQQTHTVNDKVRIINGEEVIKNSFPWQVSIRYRAERLAFCGGSIVNEKWVLTAAHCMMDEPTRSKRGQNCFAAVPNLEVYAGTHTKDGHDQKLDINAQRKKVSKFCMHPKWDDVEIYGDAALLEMQTPFYFNDFVIPICLPSPSGTPLPKDTMCVITGFGRTQGTANEKVMNQQTLPIVENKQCNRWLGAGTIPDSSQMCAGFEKGGVDTCQGDSGGPLACKHGEQWFIDGITSWGYGCGDARSPGVYTRVASPVILSWIQKITQIDIQQMRRGN